jgi:hypothetical protein
MNDHRLDRLLDAASARLRGEPAGPLPDSLRAALAGRRRARLWTRTLAVGGVAASMAAVSLLLVLPGRHGRPNPIDFTPRTPGPATDLARLEPRATPAGSPTLGYYARSIATNGPGPEAALDRCEHGRASGSPSDDGSGRGRIGRHLASAVIHRSQADATRRGPRFGWCTGPWNA